MDVYREDRTPSMSSAMRIPWTHSSRTHPARVQRCVSSIDFADMSAVPTTRSSPQVYTSASPTIRVSMVLPLASPYSASPYSAPPPAPLWKVMYLPHGNLPRRLFIIFCSLTMPTLKRNNSRRQEGSDGNRNQILLPFDKSKTASVSPHQGSAGSSECSLRESRETKSVSPHNRSGGEL